MDIKRIHWLLKDIRYADDAIAKYIEEDEYRLYKKEKQKELFFLLREEKFKVHEIYDMTKIKIEDVI